MAYNFPTTPTDGQIYQPANGPAYIWSALLNSWNPANVSGVTYATTVQLIDAIDTGITIDPKTLGEGSVISSGGIPDALKWVRLNADGKVDPTMLPATQTVSFATSVEVESGTDTTKVISPDALAGAATSFSSGIPSNGKYVRLGSDGKISPSMYDGGVVDYATAAEIIAGSENAKAVSPRYLRDATINTSAGAADANKYPRLNALGKIDTTMLPAALAKATSAEIITGTDDAKYMTALSLRGATVQTGSTAADVNKIPRLNSAGKIDASMLPAATSQFKGTIDPAVAPITTPIAGDYYYVSKNGTLVAAWGALAGTAVKANDQLIWSGTAWNIISNNVDLTGYLPLTGSSDMTGAIKWSAVQTGEVFDTNGGTISAVIDAGQY